MSCKDRVTATIQIVGESPGELKVCFLLTLVTFVIHMIGNVTSGWLVSDDECQGLYYFCLDTVQGDCCAALDDFPGSTNNAVPVFVHATRAFEVIGAILLVITLVLCGIGIKRFNANPFIRGEIRFIAASSLLSCLSILLGIIIYGAKFRDVSWMQTMDLSWSFGLCATAGCLSAVNLAVLFVYDPHDHIQR